MNDLFSHELNPYWGWSTVLAERVVHVVLSLSAYHKARIAITPAKLFSVHAER